MPASCLFIEERIVEPFVKYCSNSDFTNAKPDCSMHNFAHAFVHWSFDTWNGDRLVSDLQGGGFLLTDIQILDKRYEINQETLFTSKFL